MEKKKKRSKRKIFGNRIKEILKEIDMPQVELADMIEVDTAHMSRIINNQRESISLPIAMKIARALDRTVEEVFILNESKAEKRKVVNKQLVDIKKD